MVVSLIVSIIYGFIEVLLYVSKALLIVLAYCYFKYWGHFKKKTEEEVDEEENCSSRSTMQVSKLLNDDLKQMMDNDMK